MRAMRKPVVPLAYHKHEFILHGFLPFISNKYPSKDGVYLAY